MTSKSEVDSKLADLERRLDFEAEEIHFTSLIHADRWSKFELLFVLRMKHIFPAFRVYIILRSSQYTCVSSIEGALSRSLSIKSIFSHPFVPLNAPGVKAYVGTAADAING